MLTPNPIVLTLPGPTTETYNPAVFTGSKAEYVDNAPAMVYDARIITVSERPAAAGNSGRTSEHLMIRPIPLSSSGSCCVDVTKPEGNTIRVNSMIRKTSSKAEADALVDALIAYVQTAEFRKVVTGNY